MVSSASGVIVLLVEGDARPRVSGLPGRPRRPRLLGDRVLLGHDHLVDHLLDLPGRQRDSKGPVVDRQAEQGGHGDVPPERMTGFFSGPYGLRYTITPRPMRYTGSHWAAFHCMTGL